MSLTRFHDDPVRVQKQTEDSSYMGKYFLNTPGNGSHMAFQEDPHIRLQRWGANLLGNSMNVESDLRGLTRRLNHDSINENSYTMNRSNYSSPVYPDSRDLTVDETRSSNPAWLLRGIEIPRWEQPILNPQANLEKHFYDNIQTRLLEKDNYRAPYREIFRYTDQKEK